MISLQTRMDIDISQPEILSYIMLGNEYFHLSFRLDVYCLPSKF